MKKNTLFILWIFSLPLLAQDSVLVSPTWLKAHLTDPDLVIVQTGFLKWDYALEHIEGARFLWVPSLAPDSPENGSMNIPDIKNAVEVIQTLGISNSSHIVICHMRSEVTSAARIFMTFEQLGMKGKVSFLNGGLEAWKKAGYPVTKDIPVVKSGKFKPAVQGVLVDKDYVLKNLSAEQTLIVDARMTRFYNGEPTGNPRDGHITGAKNIPYTEMVDANNLFKPVDQLQPYFTRIDESGKKELVLYCFIGQTANVVYIAGRILGYNMKLYDASLQEWSRLKELPMEVTPTDKK